MNEESITKEYIAPYRYIHRVFGELYSLVLHLTVLKSSSLSSSITGITSVLSNSFARYSAGMMIFVEYLLCHKYYTMAATCEQKNSLWLCCRLRNSHLQDIYKT
uniref:Uncharacterized protein LOC114348937 n=1 Tax=Diabrotica virgifera virgifera TaxID=50390 RepID=A0A6P7H973_DIAVI